MDDEELTEKLRRLEATADHAERHTLALELSDTADQRVFDVLVKLIQHPDLENRRGTLVFCLGTYDCSPITNMLVGLADNGNFEVAMGASGILAEQRLR